MDTTLYDEVATGGINHLKSGINFSALVNVKSDSKLLSLDQHDEFLSQATYPSPSTTQIFFPEVVTEEEKAYAKGFEAALEEVYKRKGCTPSPIFRSGGGTKFPTRVGNPRQIDLSSSGKQPNQPVQTRSSYTALKNIPGTVGSVFRISGMTSSVDCGRPAVKLEPDVFQRSGGSTLTSNQQSTVTCSRSAVPLTVQSMMKEGAQIVPRLGTTPPAHPHSQFDDELDGGRQERKKERNREAARKCRTRKLEHIARLETRVEHLKTENDDLVQMAAALRQEVAYMRSKMVEHVNGGCVIMQQSSLISSANN